jgi:endonuclease YncB( thermonuclease family)
MGSCFSAAAPRAQEPVDTLEKTLAAVQYTGTKPFVLTVDGQQGKVVKVYDGDTLTLAFFSHGVLSRVQVRLLGIDTPEIKGKSDVEKDKAKMARQALTALVLNKVVTLRNTSMETKWGRLLADVWVGNVHVNSYMIVEGHAIPYDGSTKSHDWQGFLQADEAALVKRK